MSLKMIADQLSRKDGVKGVRTTMLNMLEAGLVERFKDPEGDEPQTFFYSIAVQKEEKKKAESGGAFAEPDTISRMQGEYLCPELRTFPDRPGAMDAYKLPSLFMGKLIYRREALTA